MHFAAVIQGHETHHDVRLANDRQAGKQPADDEQQCTGRPRQHQVFGKPVQVVGHGAQAGEGGVHATQRRHGAGQQKTHGQHHDHGLGGIGPDGGADTAREAVQCHQDGAHDGTGPGGPAQQHLQGLAAGYQLGTGIGQQEDQR